MWHSYLLCNKKKIRFDYLSETNLLEYFLVAMSTATAVITAGVSIIAMLVIVMIALHVWIVVQSPFNQCFYSIVAATLATAI